MYTAHTKKWSVSQNFNNPAKLFQTISGQKKISWCNYRSRNFCTVFQFYSKLPKLSTTRKCLPYTASRNVRKLTISGESQMVRSTWSRPQGNPHNKLTIFLLLGGGTPSCSESQSLHRSPANGSAHAEKVLSTHQQVAEQSFPPTSGKLFKE